MAFAPPPMPPPHPQHPGGWFAAPNGVAPGWAPAAPYNPYANNNTWTSRDTRGVARTPQTHCCGERAHGIPRHTKREGAGYLDPVVVAGLAFMRLGRGGRSRTSPAAKGVRHSYMAAMAVFPG
eukprot:6886481-Prymnesium_polylepis.1